MIKHFVTFYSPGTFVSEESTFEIECWDIRKATEKAKLVRERHNAKPYGFRFRTQEGERNLAKITKTSNMFYFGGIIQTLEEIKAKSVTQEDRILIYNMETNGWKRVITNTNSWKITLPLEDQDVVLPWNI